MIVVAASGVEDQKKKIVLLLVTFRTIGGVLDFFVYSGPTPEDVMAAHWSVVGRPAAPPMWSLGFHLCRWGYDTDEDLSGQIKKMRTGNKTWYCVQR